MILGVEHIYRAILEAYIIHTTLNGKFLQRVPPIEIKWASLGTLWAKMRLVVSSQAQQGSIVDKRMFWEEVLPFEVVIGSPLSFQ